MRLLDSILLEFWVRGSHLEKFEHKSIPTLTVYTIQPTANNQNKGMGVSLDATEDNKVLIVKKHRDDAQKTQDKMVTRHHRLSSSR
jgi:hypothetical protein